jgi:hypothetical protein
MASVSTPVTNYGTTFYGVLGAPLFQRSGASTSETDPYYGFHGTVGPFSRGVDYKVVTSLGGYLDYDIGTGPTYTHVTIIIPFELGKNYGNTEIILGAIGGTFLSDTTPPQQCGLSAPPPSDPTLA